MSLESPDNKEKEFDKEREERVNRILYPELYVSLLFQIVLVVIVFKMIDIKSCNDLKSVEESNLKEKIIQDDRFSLVTKVTGDEWEFFYSNSRYEKWEDSDERNKLFIKHIHDYNWIDINEYQTSYKNFVSDRTNFLSSKKGSSVLVKQLEPVSNRRVTFLNYTITDTVGYEWVIESEKGTILFSCVGREDSYKSCTTNFSNLSVKEMILPKDEDQEEEDNYCSSSEGDAI